MEGQSARSGLAAAAAAWRRRKWLVIVVFVILCAATVGVARGLPDIYTSTATLSVEHQQAQERLVGPVAAADLETRLRTVSQRVLSRSRLAELIDRFDLYPELRASAPADAVVARMRRDIELDYQAVRDPIGRDWTIALRISFEGRDPDTVARVTNVLAALYVEENARIREQQSEATTQFLRVQVEEARRQLEHWERQISALRGSSPKAAPVSPQPSPDVNRLRTELRANLDRQRRVIEYRDALSRRLAEVEGGIQPGSINSNVIISAEQMRQLRSELTDVEVHLAALRDEERVLRGRIALAASPLTALSRAEQELQISRDYEAAKQLYQVLLQRFEEAQLAERMERGLLGDQLRVLDPAVASAQPTGPSRRLLGLLGLLMSAGLAAGVAVLAESRDTSFHTLDDLRGFTNVSVLTSIPAVVTPADRLRRRLGLALGTVLTGVAAFAAVEASSRVARSSEMVIRLLTGVL